MAFKHRSTGYQLISGSGLEIGAFHQPAILAQNCKVTYCDVMSRDEAIRLFPEVQKELFVEPDYILDLDKDGLKIFEAEQFDFVIINHVIEHLANPIKAIEELFRVIKTGGNLVIACPDKEYTFDKNRKVTPFKHLLAEYRGGVTEVTDEHYVDFLEGVHPEVFENTERYLDAMKNVRNRKEHAHVWTSSTFDAFMKESQQVLSIAAECKFISIGKENQFEYFAIWEKHEKKPSTIKDKFRALFR
jgi:ubiquinone/menaquinone biosynthesis C-methylase UbiE